MKVVVIGAQWGDEGKGKMVDFFAENAEIIVRFSGGANAGHTIVTGDTTYKLHLVPSGIISPDKTAVLGNGMVIDIESLFDELATLTSQNIKWEGRIFISDRAHLVLPRYKQMDSDHDKKRKHPIGTTGRGIGFAYAEKALRTGIRAGDIFDSFAVENMEDEDKAYLEKLKEKIRPMIIDLAAFMYKHREKNILFEGAQGTLLDIDIGTYPYVSSGMSCSAGAAVGGSVGPRHLDHIIGVFKAYSTRVGNGPFPSEFDRVSEKDLEDFVRETGREYGVTTGRPRRCGYLDLVALKYACFTNSIDSLALTHLDVYDKMDEIKLCTAYDHNGKALQDFPSSIDMLNKVKPLTRTFKGWKKDLSEIKHYEDLPKEAKEYIKFIEEYTETPINMVSVGYRRSETMIRRDPWKKS
ncbi:MAG: adenylosuccinate synthase [Spirochaetales bacterium]|nr:adenylosuccinate synthase [Spirochaetales bacterium]